MAPLRECFDDDNAPCGFKLAKHLVGIQTNKCGDEKSYTCSDLIDIELVELQQPLADLVSMFRSEQKKKKKKKSNCSRSGYCSALHIPPIPGWLFKLAYNGRGRIGKSLQHYYVVFSSLDQRVDDEKGWTEKRPQIEKWTLGTKDGDVFGCWKEPSKFQYEGLAARLLRMERRKTTLEG
ncbi:hypothetical protein K504DRAFT_505383 [Pleomassaria siparia CBS 279.74]|uniref:Uncharacterized protein n=1 Tax=Pleomassaria siparia CBS 279.74 TaxID=1314801 RepID=A0A6G1K1N0_9PLEO|nr:hypothetical protein K504DRAFT_505383 [Pleomassaria siparia CBS 279.74]